MMDKKSNGLSATGALQIVFIVLKMTGLIDWSWLVVFTPLWIDLGIILILLVYLWIS